MPTPDTPKSITPKEALAALQAAAEGKDGLPVEVYQGLVALVRECRLGAGIIIMGPEALDKLFRREAGDKEAVRQS